MKKLPPLPSDASPARVLARLLSALTAYDRRQSLRPHYNIWALPQYIGRLAEIMIDVEAGASLRAAITAGFTGRLADACLRAVSLPITTREEARGTSYVYRPAAGR